MIEGTKPFRRRGSETIPAPAPKLSSPPSPSSTAPIKALEEIKPAEISPEMAEKIAFEASPEEPANAVNLERRDFFASLVPAFGDGLVKLLRTSNNLKRDFHEAMKEGSEAIAEAEVKRRRDEEKR